MRVRCCGCRRPGRTSPPILAGTGADLQRILGDLDALDGAAVEAYRNFQADMAKHLELAGTLAAATSAGLEIASTIVKIVHDLTRDVIS